jgi:hypothetical protein
MPPASGARFRATAGDLPDDNGRVRLDTGAVIDAYIAELAAELRGSRRAKADLLAEARDGLTDVADAYYLHGMDRAAAERRAVEEFGTVAELAPLYQRELGLAQGRRTALLVAFVLVMQPVLWNYGWDLLVTGGEDDPTQVIDLMINWLGASSIVLALVIALVCGRRRPGLPFRMGRVVGVFAGAVAVIFSGLGLASMVFGTDSDLTSGIGFACLAGFLFVPMSLVALSARRCLVAG